MNIKNIKSLAQIMNSEGLTAIEVSEGEVKIRIEKNISQVVQTQAVATTPAEHIAKPDATLTHTNDNVVNFNNIKEIKSPMIGVFYASPTPDSEPYVKVGDKVKKGDILCIIEAMKLMNEITAEEDGEIVDVCVENGQVVEFSQIIFKVF